MGGRDHSETCIVCDFQVGGLDDLKCRCQQPDGDRSDLKITVRAGDGWQTHVVANAVVHNGDSCVIDYAVVNPALDEIHGQPPGTAAGYNEPDPR